MEENKGLLERLQEYSQSDFYPFHMPGHKRNLDQMQIAHFPNPYSIDITEIDGFDNLHHPEGILKACMEQAASIYGADKTYYLVNGSSSGILSAICGTTTNGGTILMSRNCHKSAYHGVFLNRLKSVYCYPQIVPEYGVQGGLLPSEVEELLKTHREIQAVLVVSPTYDGIVSDIRAIAEVVHRYKKPLIVDEAHGAHFSFGKEFPTSALEAGADVVIQSLHKTLPSFTQTAVMHIKYGYIDAEKIDRYVHIFQSSSPSYVLMAGIQRCIGFMDGVGREKLTEFAKELKQLRQELGKMTNLKLIPDSMVGRFGIYDMDLSKIVVSTKASSLNGVELDRILRDNYYLEMELCTAEYVTALTSVGDTKEGLERLKQALLEIDRTLFARPSGEVTAGITALTPIVEMTIADAMEAETEAAALAESGGRVSAEYCYIYPPGIPIVAPGEVMQAQLVERILEYKRLGLPVQGTADEAADQIRVIKKRP